MTTTTAKRKTIMVCWLSWYAPACKAGHQDLVARYADPRYLPRQQNWLLVWRFSTLVTHSPLAPLCLWLLWFASAHFDAIFLAYIFKILTKRRFCFWRKRRCYFLKDINDWVSSRCLLSRRIISKMTMSTFHGGECTGKSLSRRSCGNFFKKNTKNVIELRKYWSSGRSDQFASTIP